jgi:hypothetical protein
VLLSEHGTGDGHRDVGARSPRGKGAAMSRRWASVLGLMAVGILVSGCLFDSFDDQDAFGTVDKTVNQATATKVNTFLVNNVPALRQQKAQLASGGKKIKMSVNIQAAPDPNHPKDDPDYRWHAYYYWVYVSYMSPDRLEAYKTYLVQQDFKAIFLADSETDKFVQVYPVEGKGRAY